MSLTESTMLSLGSQAPDFDLLCTDNSKVTLKSFANAEALVVLFICNHCPYVIHIADALSQLAKQYGEKNVAFVAINSNDTVAYPADNFEAMKAEKSRREYPFPYLLDEDQAVAKAYKAACTPDIFVFDKQQRLAYRGQFDSSRPHRISSGNYSSGEMPANGLDLQKALHTLLAGKTVPTEQTPSIGCNIKWKPGNEPEYF